ncbi:cytochrome P450 [Streptomyces sp. NPDC047002]|uniref:cytochrome P450 n=1 Tax=Streptomyces sp. NPDC047002 TaxID=3155475 RepID=UPI003452AEF8
MGPGPATYRTARAGKGGLPPGPRLPRAAQTLLFRTVGHRLTPRLRGRYGDMVRLRLFPEGAVVQLTDAEHIRAVLNGPDTVYHGGEGNAIVEPVLGARSVMLADELDHRRARRLLTPAFRAAALDGYRGMVARLTAEELDRWPAGVPFRAHDRMNRLTLEVVLRVVFGVTRGARLDRLRTLLRAFVDVRPVDFLGWHLPALQRVGRWRRKLAQQRELDALIHEVIRERRDAGEAGAGGTDVLSRLLGSSDEDGGLSDAELRDQLVSLLLAGHETTATALAWSLHELAWSAPLQARAARAAATGDDAFLEAVVKESLRLHPVIAEIARRVTEDVELGEYRIPAGTTVMPMIGQVHLDARYHQAPRVFDPGRFLEGPPPRETWLPFGGGARYCLGAGFALMESAVVLREVLTRFRLEPGRAGREEERARHVVLVPGHGAVVRALPRTGDPHGEAVS